MNNIKDEVKRKIEEYSNEEYLAKYIKNEFLTDNGNAEILLKVNKKNELFDLRTYGNQLDLDRDIYEFIDSKSSMLNNDIKLVLRIIGGSFEKEDKENIKHIINEHYAIELYKAQKEYRRYRAKMYKLAILGIFFLILYAVIALTVSSKLFIEILGFLFSFALWQAFENLIYTISDIRLDREAITQKIIMDVIFDSEEDE